MCGCNWRPATGAAPDAGNPSVEPLAIACRVETASKRERK